MSASTTPTFWPEAASAAARFTVTDDLPTPPLPLATAYTRVSEDGWANGICGSACPPRSWVCSARRCSSLITSSWTRTEDTPGSLPTAAVTSRVIFSRSGHPATVSHTSTSTAPSAATSTFLTMPSSVIGRWISGSCTPSSAWVTCSALGGSMVGEFMASWYVAVLPASQAPPAKPARRGQRRGTAEAATAGTVAASAARSGLPLDDLARGRVEDHRPEARHGEEVEQTAGAVQRAGDRVVGAAADPRPVQPVVLDEPGDRGRVDQLAADVVRPGPGRDHQQRQPLAVTAPVGEAAKRHGRRGADRRVQRRVRAVHDHRGLVVVPAVGVVVGDHDRGGPPELGLLDLVDRVHQEVLLVQRVGVAGVAVLVLRRLQEADRRHVPGAERGVEVRQVVLVAGLVGVPDGGLGARRQVLGVSGRLVVLERLVVRRVVSDLGAADVRALVAADRESGAVGPGRREAALEPAPGDAPGVEQVTDVLAGRDGHRVGRGVAGVGAIVKGGVGVTVDGAEARAVGRAHGTRGRYGLPGAGADRHAAAGLARDQVERAGCRRAEGGVVVVVAHRIVLCVVPQPGDRVAVVVVHDQAGRAEVRGRAGADVGELDELVHLAAVDGLLLRRVTVVLVAGQGLRVGQPGGVAAVRVAGEQRPDRAAGGDLGVQAVHRRGPRLGVERAPVGVGRERVGAEVVVERHVLVEDHDHVLDRRRGPAGPEGPTARARGDGLRRRVRAGHRGADGEAGADDGGGGDGRVTPGFPVSGTDRGWAFAHLALLSLLAECTGEPPTGLRGRGAGARERTQEQKL